MNLEDFVFYFLAIFTVVSALGVVTMANPVYSALMLVLTMLGVATVFFTLEAYFIAGVQLIVYAGAVVVMFVLVIMIFDLKKEVETFTKGAFGGLVKVGTTAVLFGFILSSIYWMMTNTVIEKSNSLTEQGLSTKALAYHLYTKYILAFELVGVLLLVALVGAIAIAKSRGGTHEV